MISSIMLIEPSPPPPDTAYGERPSTFAHRSTSGRFSAADPRCRRSTLYVGTQGPRPDQLRREGLSAYLDGSAADPWRYAHSMTDLENLVPSPEPAEDTIITALEVGLDAIPVIGPMATRVIDHALSVRADERRHDFDMAVIAELRRLAESVDNTLTVAEVLSSDDFAATLARTQRLAAETASETKRERLARATVGTLSSSAVSRVERAQFLRYIEEFEDLHVWLLGYFASPRAWLDAHSMSDVYTGPTGGTVLDPFARIFGAPEADWITPVETAIATLDGYGLVSVPRQHMTGSGMVETRTSDRGRRFLEHLHEDAPAGAEPPTEL